MSTLLSMANAPIHHSRSVSLGNPVTYSEPNSTWRKSTYSATPGKTSSWSTRHIRGPSLKAMGEDMNVRKWDGAGRRSIEWDGLRRDPDLWYPKGNCFVHLYSQGQSRRGPAFRIPFDALVAANCRPLLDRFLVIESNGSPVSDISSEDSGYFDPPTEKQYNLYMPAPATSERGQAFLYHTATRNFFAWVFSKSLVGSHLGGALVGLLNSMNEFREKGEDNVQSIMDYMDEEGYADMRNQPDNALAILFFAEHFRFKDLWIDAFAHCAGMNDILICSAGFEFITRQSRAFITRSRLEMDMRLDQCGRKLSSFLSDDLSEANLSLSTGARNHMDKFRTFLQSYYVAKLGYYPPTSAVTGSAIFPKNIYLQMCSEFQRLYDLLVDTELTATDILPVTRQGGICVLQSVQAFDQRNKHTPLQNPFPLLPEIEDASSPTSPTKRMSWLSGKQDKMKPDGRLVTFSHLDKATNRQNSALYDCSLVRAYRGFEKECVFYPTKSDVKEKLSQTEARKVRWILIYSILQTLLAATRAPEQVRDTHNVPYNLSVLTGGCPPWKHERPIQTLLRTQTDQAKEDFLASTAPPSREESSSVILTNETKDIVPDINYFALMHRERNPLTRATSESTISRFASRRGTVRRAISSLGNMPELHHPSPKRAPFHEILVQGYGNGTKTVTLAQPHERKVSTETTGSYDEPNSSRWSNSTYNDEGHEDIERTTSPLSSVSSNSSSKAPIERDSSSPTPKPLNITKPPPNPSYSPSIYDEDELSGNSFHRALRMKPSYLSIDTKNLKKMTASDYDYYMTVTTDVKVVYESSLEGLNDDYKRGQMLTQIGAMPRYG